MSALPKACDATKELNDLKGEAPILTLRCDLDRGHTDKTHFDAAYRVRWFS